jgi:hypothetical protein
VKIGVADAAEKDFDLDIVFGRFPSRNRGEASGDVALAAE